MGKFLYALLMVSLISLVPISAHAESGLAEVDKQPIPMVTEKAQPFGGYLKEHAFGDGFKEFHTGIYYNAKSIKVLKSNENWQEVSIQMGVLDNKWIIKRPTTFTFIFDYDLKNHTMWAQIKNKRLFQGPFVVGEGNLLAAGFPKGKVALGSLADYVGDFVYYHVNHKPWGPNSIDWSFLEEK